MRSYTLTAWGYTYNSKIGNPDAKISSGTTFEDAPPDWRCLVYSTAQDNWEQ